MEGDAGAENLDLHRKQRRTHDLAHDLLDARRRQQIAGPDADLVTVDEERREERQPRDVIEVAMGEENLDLAARAVLHQRVAEWQQAGTGVEDQDVIAAGDFDARRIAAIANGVGTGTSDTAPHSPEPYTHE